MVIIRIIPNLIREDNLFKSHQSNFFTKINYQQN